MFWLSLDFSVKIILSIFSNFLWPEKLTHKCWAVLKNFDYFMMKLTKTTNFDKLPNGFFLYKYNSYHSRIEVKQIAQLFLCHFLILTRDLKFESNSQSILSKDCNFNMLSTAKKIRTDDSVREPDPISFQVCTLKLCCLEFPHFWCSRLKKGLILWIDL